MSTTILLVIQRSSTLTVAQELSCVLAAKYVPRSGLGSIIGEKVISPFADLAPACAPACHVYLVWWRALLIPVCGYHNWVADQHSCLCPNA